MTERERWIVYPLLFLALGAALRDKLSEHTTTKRLESEHASIKSLECQELVIYSEGSAEQDPVALVRIGGVQRDSADLPPLGQILVNGQIVVNGLIHANGIEAEMMQAAKINADNYFFQRYPIAPLMRAIPGVSPADQLRARQLHQDDDAAEDESPPGRFRAEDKVKPSNEPVPAAKSTAPPGDDAPPNDAAPPAE